MIFVTVGTHEQPFNRLIKGMDELIKNKIINEEVVIQTGFSTYLPENCKWRKMLSYSDMERYMKEARIVITHGGPSSFIKPVQLKKIPIVVPRLHRYNEHVNNHQFEFVRKIEEMNIIIPCYEIKELGKIINDYNNIVASKSKTNVENNTRFNQLLDKMVEDMFSK